MTKPTSRERLKQRLREKAEALGFDLCRVTRQVRAQTPAANLSAFLNQGYHGDMTWMRETESRRGAPSALWPEVQTAVVLAMNYGPDENPLVNLSRHERANISVYARNRDYHDIIKGRLKELAQSLLANARRAGLDEEAVKVFVDTAPIMEKPLAQAAGLGWQGKHTNLVSRELGSWFFIGEIFTTLELPEDPPERDHCGSCRACLDACPTGAFPAPYQIDARRCISYLTIENAGPIPAEFRAAMGNRIYGCDDCLAACPWNKFAQSARESKLHARDDLKSPQLADLLQLDDASFRTLFAGSPVKRIGRDRFLRNVLIAAGNSGQRNLASHVIELTRDPGELVRGAAIWAARRLLSASAFAALRREKIGGETSPDVINEWNDVAQ